MAESLSQRSADVLDTLVERYILTGQPVGSATVADGFPEPISSATIRNVMAELEEHGYLRQPHTSAGRMPTAHGYRLYVERLLQQRRLRRVDESSIKQKLGAARPEVAGLLQRACSLLSSMSRHVGVVLAPPLADTVIRHVEFVRLGSGRVLVVFVTRGGMVHTRAIRLRGDLPRGDLEAAAAYLAAHFSGRTLREVREQLQEHTLQRKSDRPRHLAFRLGARSLGPGIDEAEVLVEGASRLLDSPELADADVFQSLFAACEERTELGRLLNEYGAGYSPQVVIGDEGMPAALGSCTLIAAGYGSTDRPWGALGILGPTRMEYARAIPVVAAMARATSDRISELYG